MTDPKKRPALSADVEALLQHVGAEIQAEDDREEAKKRHITEEEARAARIEKIRQRQRAEQAGKEALAILESGGDTRGIIGHHFEGRGVYLGKYEPTDRDGNSLGRIFNVFAAPEFLKDDTRYGTLKALFSHNEAVERIARLRNFHGHDGGNYADDKALTAAIKSGSYKGGWVLPPRELLCGIDFNGNLVQKDNLYAHRNDGAFAEIFNAEVVNGDATYWFRSCTSGKGWGKGKLVWSTRFSDGKYRSDNAGPKDRVGSSCWPVRLEPARM